MVCPGLPQPGDPAQGGKQSFPLKPWGEKSFFPSSGSSGDILEANFLENALFTYSFDYRWINCIAVIAPKKKIVGTPRACTANQRTVKIG